MPDDPIQQGENQNQEPKPVQDTEQSRSVEENPQKIYPPSLTIY